MGEWIEHDGSGLPVPHASRVEVKFRDGFEAVDPIYIAAELHDETPSRSCWVHSGGRADIITYRLVEDSK